MLFLNRAIDTVRHSPPPLLPLPCPWWPLGLGLGTPCYHPSSLLPTDRTLDWFRCLAGAPAPLQCSSNMYSAELDRLRHYRPAVMMLTISDTFLHSFSLFLFQLLFCFSLPLFSFFLSPSHVLSLSFLLFLFPFCFLFSLSPTAILSWKLFAVSVSLTNRTPWGENQLSSRFTPQSSDFRDSESPAKSAISPSTGPLSVFMVAL